MRQVAQVKFLEAIDQLAKKYKARRRAATSRLRGGKCACSIPSLPNLQPQPKMPCAVSLPAKGEVRRRSALNPNWRQLCRPSAAAVHAFLAARLCRYPIGELLTLLAFPAGYPV